MKRIFIDIALAAWAVSLLVTLNLIFRDDEALKISGFGFGSRTTDRVYIAHGMVFVLGSLWMFVIPSLRGSSWVADYLGRFCRNGDYRVFYALAGILILLGCGSIAMGAMSLGAPNP